MDRADVSILLSLMLTLAACMYGSYRWGRHVQLKAIVIDIQGMTERTYKEAYQDGLQAGESWEWQREQALKAS